MRIVNGEELDDGVDEPGFYDWHIDYASDQLHKVTEQRDRLAEVIAQYLPYVPDMQPIGAARHIDANVKAWALRQALQSLTTKNDE